MKNLLLTLLLVFTSLFAKSQTDDLPRYFVENGDTIGIILSVEQAQSLDNDAELLGLFKKMQINCDSLEVGYIKIINKLGEKIGILEIQKKDLISQGEEKDKLIKNLESSLSYCERMYQLCREEVANKDREIAILKRELLKQKLKKLLSFGGNAVAAIIIAVLIIKN
jgi:predicted RNase H-like nuclease (RuvC/YqgF family)